MVVEMTENTEELLIGLLQDIIDLLQTGEWFVADYDGDFNNEVSLLTHKSVEKSWDMKVRLIKKV